MTMASVETRKRSTLEELGIVTINTSSNPDKIDILRIPCKPAILIETSNIVKKLLETFKRLQEETDIKPVGLAAPQIGINAKVAYVNVFRPIFIVNPSYVSRSGETLQEEECISLPGERVLTSRNKLVVLESQGKRMKFGFPLEADSYNTPVMVRTVKGQYKFYVSQELVELECAAVQHEIDHLNGVLITEREYKQIVEKVV